ncbi:MAG: helix-turn-helix domain-containing protein [Patescibacteria group bacterium]
MIQNLDKKGVNGLNIKLQKLGLSEKEGSVYLFLLGRSVEVGSSKIVTGLKLHGQYVYQALYSLEEKGLIKHVIKNGRKKWSANSPKRLEMLIKEKQIIASELENNLHNLFAHTQEQEFEVYQGRDQFIVHEFQMIDNAAEGDFIDILGGQKKFRELMGEEAEEYNKKSMGKKVKIRIIGSHEQVDYLKKIKENRPYFDYRTMPNFNEGMVSTSIRPQSITFQVYGSPILIFTIKSSDIAQNYKNFFEALWLLCPAE